MSNTHNRTESKSPLHRRAPKPDPTGRAVTIDPHDVQDRGQLNEYLSQSLASEYRVFGPRGEVAQTATFLKSYILEGHSNRDAPTTQQWLQVFPSVIPRRDDTLLLLVDRAGVSYFADVSDGRFLVIHSIGRTEATDATIERLTQGGLEGFDRAWLPTDFLLGTRRGPLRGFKFGYQASVAGMAGRDEEPGGDELQTFESDEEHDDAAAHSATGSTNFNASGLWSRLTVSNTLTAEVDYRKIKEARVFDGRQALDSVQFVSVNAQQERVTNGVYAAGKIIGSGTSLGLHQVVVNGVLSTYARVIRSIESDFALGWVQEGGGSVHRGEPLIFSFPEGLIFDLYSFVASVFSSTKPFRLFGIPHSMSDRRIDVEGIDLHTNDPIGFEITHSWMRVYLPRGSCGNILARLYTNLQHAVHSDISLVAGSGLALFTEGDAREE